MSRTFASSALGVWFQWRAARPNQGSSTMDHRASSAITMAARAATRTPVAVEEGGGVLAPSE